MHVSLKYFLKLLVITGCFQLLVSAQEKKEDFVENFDGSKQELSEIVPDAEKEDSAEANEAEKIALGELSKDKIKQDKMTESLENELESENAKSAKLDARIQSTLEKMRPALSSSGLELNQPEVFPADI